MLWNGVSGKQKEKSPELLASLPEKRNHLQECGRPKQKRSLQGSLVSESYLPRSPFSVRGTDGSDNDLHKDGTEASEH